MSELKPCPFCGGKAKTQSFYRDHRVYCRTCNASTMCYYETKEKAIAAWNRRVGDDLMERMVDDGK